MYEKYRLGKITRLDFIEKKKHFDYEIEEIRKAKLENQEVEEIKEDELTRGLMEKYIESVLLENNEVVKINWK